MIIWAILQKPNPGLRTSGLGRILLFSLSFTCYQWPPIFFKTEQCNEGMGGRGREPRVFVSGSRERTAQHDAEREWFTLTVYAFS